MQRATTARLLTALLSAGLISLSASAAAAQAAPPSYIGGFAADPPDIATTVPANGDINPYGIAAVPQTIGAERRGSLLVSNFNAASNLQGTGTTIVQIPRGGNSTSGAASLFAQIDPSKVACPGGIGLTTALSVAADGDVIVGSLATTDGMSDSAGAGCLIVLDPNGHVLSSISGGSIDGPWDMTALSAGPLTQLFVTNVLNGTVSRIALLSPSPWCPPLKLEDRVIGTGFSHTPDPAALEIGPTGDALGANGTLYVADSVNNRIAAIPNALTRLQPSGNGVTVSSGGTLNDPLGLTLAPNGDILTANGNDGNVVETTPSGHQVATVEVDPAGAGVLFGLTTDPGTTGVFLVDDGSNTLKLLH